MGFAGRNRIICFKVLGLIFAVCLGWAGVRAAAEEQPNQAREQALRKRVEEYYSLMQVGRYTQAEDYVEADSKETFRKLGKSPFLGFQIETVVLGPDGKSARVGSQLRVYLPGFSPKPMDMPQITNWRLAEGLWYLTLPKDLPASPLAAIAKERPAPRAPHPEELKFKGHRYNLAKMDPTQKKVARFPFTNVSDHVVTIAAVLTGNPLLTVEDYKKEYKPGESGELAIELAPVGMEREFAQGVVVKTNPGGLITYLTVRAYVNPQAHEYPKPGGRNRPLPAPQSH